jgi:hypothetical protein
MPSPHGSDPGHHVAIAPSATSILGWGCVSHSSVNGVLSKLVHLPDDWLRPCLRDDPHAYRPTPLHQTAKATAIGTPEQRSRRPANVSSSCTVKHGQRVPRGVPRKAPRKESLRVPRSVLSAVPRNVPRKEPPQVPRNEPTTSYQLPTTNRQLPRHSHHKPSSAARCILHRHGAAVCFDDCLDEAQSEAKSALRAARVPTV